MTKEEKLQFKFKYDKMLDDVFFTKEFKQYMIEYLLLVDYQYYTL